jgi:shikimate dehydrogenase
MRQFYSLSKYPGKSGYHFYNSFFKLHGVEAEYTPLGIAEHEFTETFRSLVQHEVSGISVSMPYKEKVIELLDWVSPEVQRYNSCNTVVRKGSSYMGYNTDIDGVIAVSKELLPNDRILILGNGSMGKMFARYLADRYITVSSRSLGTWELRHTPYDVLINCTAFGTINIDSPVNCLPDETRLVIDLAVNPGKLKEQTVDANTRYVGGNEFYMHQFIKQYKLYTELDVTINDFEQVNKNR